MDIANLQAFVAVAETGSFSQASEQLFLTQPAISKRIVSLENELDTRLFDRIGRQVKLTQSGEVLLPRAREILQQVEQCRRTIQNLSGHVAGKLSIGTSHHIGLHRLPPVLRRFTRRYPDVELDLHFMDSEEACRAVEHGDLELGIVTLPLNPPQQLHTRIIWPDPLALVVNRQHPLAEKKRISVKTLAEYPAVLPTSGTYTRQVLEHQLSQFDVKLKIGLATNYLETIKMMVSVGLGWSILPLSMLSSDLTPLPVSGIRLQRELGVVWHQHHTLSNAASEMINSLQ